MGLNNIIHPHRCHQNYSNSNGLAQLEPLQLSSSVESTSTTDSIVGSISSEVANLALSHQTTPSHTKVDTPTAINIERDRPRRPLLQHYKEAPARILLPSSITPSLAPAHSFVSETRGPHPTHAIISYGNDKHIFYAHIALIAMSGMMAHSLGSHGHLWAERRRCTHTQQMHLSLPASHAWC